MNGQTTHFNDGHLAEALDRLDGFIAGIDDRLIDHPAITRLDLSNELQKATDALMGCYQKIGAVINKIETEDTK